VPEHIVHGEANILGDLAQQNRGNITPGMKGGGSGLPSA